MTDTRRSTSQKSEGGRRMMSGGKRWVVAVALVFLAAPVPAPTDVATEWARLQACEALFTRTIEAGTEAMAAVVSALRADPVALKSESVRDALMTWTTANVTEREAHAAVAIQSLALARALDRAELIDNRILGCPGGG